MADNEKKQAAEQDQPVALKDGESLEGTSFYEENVNPMSAAEEAERQQAENYPNRSGVTTFEGQHEDGPEKARQGFAATHRAEVGRVIVLHEDTEHDGELYKAGVQDIPLKVADAFIKDGKAFEPAGKKKGR